MTAYRKAFQASVARGIKPSAWLPPSLAFSAADAAFTFKQHTAVDFHHTVPGQLLARRGVRKCGVDAQGRAMYSRDAWRFLWDDMVYLAKRRARFGEIPAPSSLPEKVPPLLRCPC